MPLVEFGCPECGRVEELLVRRTSEADKPLCPACGIPMEKKFSAFAAKVSGSGGGGCGHASGGCGGGGGFS